MQESEGVVRESQLSPTQATKAAEPIATTSRHVANSLEASASDMESDLPTFKPVAAPRQRRRAGEGPSQPPTRVMRRRQASQSDNNSLAASESIDTEGDHALATLPESPSQRWATHSLSTQGNTWNATPDQLGPSDSYGVIVEDEEPHEEIELPDTDGEDASDDDGVAPTAEPVAEMSCDDQDDAMDATASDPAVNAPGSVDDEEPETRRRPHHRRR